MGALCLSFILSVSRIIETGCYDWALGLPVGRNWLTFDGDSVPADTDFQSLFHFPHHCRILGDLLAFLVQLLASFHDAWGEMTDADILGAIWQTSRSESGLIQKSRFESGLIQI